MVLLYFHEMIWMKRRSFMASSVSPVLTTGVLFLIGHLFTIPWFMITKMGSSFQQAH